MFSFTHGLRRGNFIDRVVRLPMQQRFHVLRTQFAEIEIVDVTPNQFVQDQGREHPVVGDFDGLDDGGRLLDFWAAVGAVIGMREGRNLIRFGIVSRRGIDWLREGDFETVGFDVNAS